MQETNRTINSLIDNIIGWTGASLPVRQELARSFLNSAKFNGFILNQFTHAIIIAIGWQEFGSTSLAIVWLVASALAGIVLQIGVRNCPENIIRENPTRIAIIATLWGAGIGTIWGGRVLPFY